MPLFFKMLRSHQLGNKVLHWGLLIGLYGFLMSLLIGRGFKGLSLMICAISALGIIIFNRKWAGLGMQVWLLLASGVLFIVISALSTENTLAFDIYDVIMWSMVAAIAVVLAPARISYNISHESVLTMLMAVFVIFHMCMNMWGPEPGDYGYTGAFSSLHYMAQYAVIVFFLMALLAVINHNFARWVMIFALVADLILLMQTKSRPGYLALIAGISVLIMQISSRYRAMAVSSLVAMLSLIYASGLFGFSSRIDELVYRFGEEERWTIWRECLLLLQSSSLLELFLGHGLGQFFLDYQRVSSFHPQRDFVSPHNFFLELFYSHGLVGLILVTMLYCLWYRSMLSVVASSRSAPQHAVGVFMIGMMTAHFIFGFFTLPFFSIHNLYPLSLILGASLRYLDVNRDNAL